MNYFIMTDDGGPPAMHGPYHTEDEAIQAYMKLAEDNKIIGNGWDYLLEYTTANGNLRIGDIFPVELWKDDEKVAWGNSKCIF